MPHEFRPSAFSFSLDLTDIARPQFLETIDMCSASAGPHAVNAALVRDLNLKGIGGYHFRGLDCRFALEGVNDTEE